MSAFLWSGRIRQKRQSDRQIEEENAFKGSGGETNRWTSFRSKALNLLLHSLINKAEIGHQGEDVQAKEGKR